MALRALLIDHDDTLLSTFDLRAEVLQQSLQEVFGVAVDGRAFLAASHGRNLQQMAADFSDEPHRHEQLAEVYRGHYYRRNHSGLHVYPGIAAMLGAVRERGLAVAVVTSKLGRGAEAELTGAGLAVHIDTVVGAEHVERPKPDAEPLRLALQRLGAAAGDALMVGDTSADMLGARAAGVTAVAALWGSQDVPGLLSATPDHVLRAPGDLLALLDA